MRRSAPLPSLGALALVVLAPAAGATEVGQHRVPVGGQVRAIRVADLDRDGRKDLVVLVERATGGGATAEELLLLRTPPAPAGAAFYRPEDRRLVALEGPDAPEALRRAGGVAVGGFGEGGAPRIRFFGPEGVTDLDPGGALLPLGERAGPTLLGRSPGRSIVFWDEHADLDGDGVEECWFPAAEGNGHLRVLGGTPAGDRTLDLEVANRAASDAEHRVIRYASLPRLAAADLDGDGGRELVQHEEGTLVVRDPRRPDAAPLRVALPFVRTDLGPDEIHTPRLQLADVDGDGKTDLLVTLVTGNRTQVGSFRTRLLHYPGPFVDPGTGRLVEPRVRIDTESVALHPRFLDIDGDGALDYVSDSIRGTKMDLLRRVLGQEPTTWYVAFLFDRAARTFEQVPSFAVERPYSREEAISNRFGRTGYLEGDFDGDGRKDLLDLGNLSGVEILGSGRREGTGPGDPIVFESRVLPRVRVPEPLLAQAVVADLTGDGLADAVLTSPEDLWLLVPRRSR